MEVGGGRIPIKGSAQANSGENSPAAPARDRTGDLQIMRPGALPHN